MTPYVNVLKQVDIFYQLNPTQLELIANLCWEQTCKSGEIIFPEGANSDELYVIVRGEVDIQVNPTSFGAQTGNILSPLTIAKLRRGQSFGEIALVDQGLRSATARAAENNTTVLVIPRDKLMKLCDAYPQLGYILMRNLAADLAMKIRNTNLRMREEEFTRTQKKRG